MLAAAGATVDCSCDDGLAAAAAGTAAGCSVRRGLTAVIDEGRDP